MTINLDNYKVEGRLVLCTCDENMRSYYRHFKWPKPGEIAQTPDCRNEFHGLLEGNGDVSLCNWNDSALWLVLDTLDSEIIQLFGKVKFRRCRVLFAGKLPDAIKILRRFGVSGTIVGDTIEVGDLCKAAVGGGGIAIAGKYGIATAGKFGRAIAGDHGTAIVGIWGTAIVGNNGIAIAGNQGTAAAGEQGVIVIAYCDPLSRQRFTTGYVGENGINPNTLYYADNNGKLIKVGEIKTDDKLILNRMTQNFT